MFGSAIRAAPASQKGQEGSATDRRSDLGCEVSLLMLSRAAPLSLPRLKDLAQPHPGRTPSSSLQGWREPACPNEFWALLHWLRTSSTLKSGAPPRAHRTVQFDQHLLETPQGLHRPQCLRSPPMSTSHISVWSFSVTHAAQIKLACPYHPRVPSTPGGHGGVQIRLPRPQVPLHLPHPDSFSADVLLWGWSGLGWGTPPPALRLSSALSQPVWILRRLRGRRGWTEGGEKRVGGRERQRRDRPTDSRQQTETDRRTLAQFLLEEALDKPVAEGPLEAPVHGSATRGLWKLRLRLLRLGQPDRPLHRPLGTPHKLASVELDVPISASKFLPSPPFLQGTLGLLVRVGRVVVGGNSGILSPLLHSPSTHTPSRG